MRRGRLQPRIQLPLQSAALDPAAPGCIARGARHGRWMGHGVRCGEIRQHVLVLRLGVFEIEGGGAGGPCGEVLRVELGDYCVEVAAWTYGPVGGGREGRVCGGE